MAAFVAGNDAPLNAERVAARLAQRNESGDEKAGGEASILCSGTSLGNRSARQRPTSVPAGAVRTDTLADAVPDTQPPSSPATTRRSSAIAPRRAGGAQRKVAMSASV
jgi:hypothetical protein